VTFQLDTPVHETHWFIDEIFYDAAISPIVNFDFEGTYGIKVEAKDADGCMFTDSLTYQVWARTPLVLNVRPGKNMDLSVYPNPSSDYIHLMTEHLVAHLGVYDTQGKLLMEKNIPTAAAGRSAHGLDIHNLPTGPYLLRVRFANSEIQTQRFLKR